MKHTHGIGWCVPVAVAEVTGLSPEQVWLAILADRQARGRPLTMRKGARLDDPLGAGGAHAAEALRVIERHGAYRAIDAWRGTRRMGYAEFLRFADAWERRGGPAEWLVLQRMHLAYLPQSWTWQRTGSLYPGLPIAKAWRIEPNYPDTDPCDADFDLLAGTMAVGHALRAD